MTTHLTWYDVLGVSRGASPEEIKAAWRHATDTFEPGSGSAQFRMFNEAADVLLDPARRSAYDAELGDQRDGQGDDRRDGRPVAAPVAAPAPVLLAKDRSEEPAADAAVVHEGPDALAEDDRDEQDHEDEQVQPHPARASRSRRPSRAQVVLAAVLALLSVVAVVFAVRFGLAVREEGRVADARDEAPAAAERAAKAMLSYNYKQLPADRERAAAYLTDSFKKKYLANFTLLEKQKDGTPGAAVQTKTVVTATVLGSGVVDAEDGAARVLVYVNQVSQKPGVDPQIFQNRVSMKMEQHGNRWLVADLKSY